MEEDVVDEDAAVTAGTADVDFSQVDDVPAGKLKLAIKKAEKKVSAAGNPMLNMQFTIVDGEDGKYNKRVIFDTWMLSTGAIYKTKKALKAFTGSEPTGPTSIDLKALIGQTCWCEVSVEPATEQYQAKSKITKYGVAAAE